MRASEVDISLHGELTGAAARRRGRRLRSWLRHERHTVAMVLAEACHHSSGSFPPALKKRRMAGQDAYEALRGQKAARTVGERPAPLVEVVEPRAGAVTDGYVAAPVPSLALPLLAGAAGEDVDSSSLWFLTYAALRKRQKEEEVRKREEKEKEEAQRALDDFFSSPWALNAEARGSQERKEEKRRRKKKKRRKKKTPKTSSSAGRPCDHQRQVLAVHVVRELRGAPVPVHRQSGGHSCFMSMDLADPVSSGKYSGTFVLTAPVAEPSVASYTVPLDGCTIVATATVVTSCSSSADCPGSAAPMCCGGVCVAMSCGGGFSLLMVLTILRWTALCR